MSQQPKTKEFKELQDEWYEKLKKEGFNDIETDEDNLKQWESYIFSRYDENLIPFKTEYFRLAGQFLHTHKFKSKKLRKMWKYHSEGYSFNEISEKMAHYEGASRSSIHVQVNKLAKEMLKQYAATNEPEGSDSDQEL